MARSWKDKESWEREAPMARNDDWEVEVWEDCGEEAGNREPNFQYVHKEDPDYKAWADYGHRMGYDSDRYIKSKMPDLGKLYKERQQRKAEWEARCKGK